jgi:hypothetical protein
MTPASSTIPPDSAFVRSESRLVIALRRFFTLFFFIPIEWCVLPQHISVENNYIKIGAVLCHVGIAERGRQSQYRQSADYFSSLRPLFCLQRWTRRLVFLHK